MALDREATLKKAEKLLRQGRLDGAIAEYVRVVEDQPRDWNTANALGDLYARAGQPDKAVAQYTRIAEHFSSEGFFPKAAALYKKILKIHPHDESTQLQLADLSAKQGLFADAKSQLNAVAARRRNRGDRRGAAEIVVRLGSLDPGDFDARFAAARALEEMGDATGAASRYRSLHDDLIEKARPSDALDALRHVVRLSPADRDARSALARAAIQAGDTNAAREYLDRETASGDPTLLVALADMQLRSGQMEEVRELLPELLRQDPSLRPRVIELAWSLTGADDAAALLCIDAAADAAIAASDFRAAADLLQEFARRVPGQIAALLRLVEVAVDGGFETTMYEAQAQLADAYLESGQGAEARVIAEDLVAREPWEGAHIARFRRALVMLRVSDPDSVIAERLSGGQAPFMATDPFADVPAPAVEAAAADVMVEESSIDSSVERPSTETTERGLGLGAREPEAPAPSTEEAGEIDLSGALGLLDANAAPPAKKLEDVFQGRRRDAVAAAASDFSAQYMKLARTYLEMGMVDEAMASLSTAVQSPRQRFEAASLLGRLHLRRGERQQAIEWLERAAEAPAPTAEDGRALLYDLGVTLDSSNETARALAVFLELQAEAGDYKDVPARIDRLARVQAGG